jgi:hypothetical protein
MLFGYRAPVILNWFIAHIKIDACATLREQFVA